MKALRRIESSGFTIEEALTLSELETMAHAGNMPELLANRIVTMADALPGVPELCVSEYLAAKISNGKSLTMEEITPVKMNNRNNLLKAVDPDRNLLAVLKYDEISKTYGYCCVFH